MTARITDIAAARGSHPRNGGSTNERSVPPMAVPNIATVAEPAANPLPCGGVCQVDNWPTAEPTGPGRISHLWNCSAFDDGWPCSRHENHTGPHVHCRVDSADPNHHNIHRWDDTPFVLADALIVEAILGNELGGLSVRDGWDDPVPTIADLIDDMRWKYRCSYSDAFDLAARYGYCFAQARRWERRRINTRKAA